MTAPEPTVPAEPEPALYVLPPEPAGTVEVVGGFHVGLRATRRGDAWYAGHEAWSWAELLTAAGPDGLRLIHEGRQSA